jgi:alkylation response protein AidB-like acyl-CoA dehydrogenase
LVVPAFAQRLEQALGSAFDPDSPASLASAVRLDEREEFPADFMAALRREGAHYNLIPQELGGSLESFEESALVLRLIARRDLTAAIAFGQTFLGSIPVWLAGTEPQKQALAAAIRGGELGCLALTEELHGGDLLACDFRAVPEGSRYLLSGRKWLINNGSRGGLATVFARTGEPSAAGFSLFLVEKSKIADAARLLPLAKIRTHGIRGADISGFECRDLPLPESAVVGAPGLGYELTLKTLQISRTMCAALSLGAADTALRTALEFALDRRIFGDTVANIPSARAQLAGAYTGLLICECLSLAATRALDACPERLPVWSSVVKYLVPSMVDELIRESAVVLGARHYLREGLHGGIFQKVMRDNAVVGLFDGSTAVNLHIVSGQLNALASMRGTSPELRGRLNRIFSRGVDLPWRGFPAASRLKFTNGGYDEIVDGLLMVEAADLPPQIAALVRQVVEDLEVLDRAVATIDDPQDRRANSARRFVLAKRYCWILAAAACLLVWVHNRGGRDEFFERGEWLSAALGHLVSRLRPGITAEAPDAVFSRMVEQYRRNELFSLWPLALGGAARAQSV